MQLKNDSVNVNVSEYRQEKSYVTYIVQVKTRNNQQWQLEKRYSHFEDLQKKLSELFHALPQLPKKSFVTFLVGKSADDLEVRRVGLDEYLKQLVVRKDVFSSMALRSFLELPEEITPPTLSSELGLPHGVRDFAISIQQGLFFVIDSDMNVLNRVDAYMSNMKLPWESERGEPTAVAVGRVECFMLNASNVFEKCWHREYNSQAICLYWDSDACKLLVGLDSGSINYLNIPYKQNEFQKFDESLEIEVHSSRVMGLFYRKKLINSISKDRHYKVVDMEKGQMCADIELSYYELTYLTFNEDRKIALVGDRAGQAFILSLEHVKPQLIRTIKTQTGFIRGLCIDDGKNYAITVSYDDGGISVIDISLPGQEGSSKLKTKIQHKQKSREVQWSRSRGELLVGNDDGTVTVWNAVDLSATYVMKAHDGAITKMIWFETEQVLMTGGKDKMIKWWKLPKEWRKKEIVEKEQHQIVVESKLQSMLKLQDENKRKEVDSDDDDGELGSWHK